MLFEWDEAKSAKVKAERGVSFEELSIAIDDGGLLEILDHPTNPNQSFFIVRFKNAIWVVVTEERRAYARIVTAYPSRKWRKKYGI